MGIVRSLKAQDDLDCPGGSGQGDDLDQLRGPCGIALSKDGALMVADSGNHRILLYEHGSLQGSCIVGGNGCGNELNQLNWPHGLSMDASGALLIADQYNYRVMQWQIGGKEGKVVAGGN